MKNFIRVAFLAVALCGTSSVALAAAIPRSCSAINQAIQALPAEGGEIQLAAGEYICKRPIVINRDGVSLKGHGALKTRIRSANGKAMPVVVIGEPQTKDLYPVRSTYNVTIQGIAIIGSRATHRDPKNHECYNFVKFKSTSCLTGDGYLVRNNGITVRAAHHVRISDVITDDHISGGIVLEKVSSDVVIDGFISRHNFYDGFAGYETTGSVIRNFDIRRNGYSGLSVDIRFTGNIFEDGVIAENLDNGVFSANVGSNTYRRLQVIDNKNLGFYFDGSRDKGADGQSILIPNTCNDNLISDTLISGGVIGVRVNHICQNLMLERVLIRQRQKQCTSYFEGALVRETDLICEGT